MVYLFGIAKDICQKRKRQAPQVNEFEAEIAELNKKLDGLELEISMSQEALESIEIRLRLLNTELDFDIEGS